MIKVPTENGEITISDAVFTTITGAAATNCFGVKGMAYRSMTDGLVHLLRPEAMSKGVGHHTMKTGTVSIELHIVVENGVNIATVCRSIMGEVRYMVSENTGATSAASTSAWTPSLCEAPGRRTDMTDKISGGAFKQMVLFGAASITRHRKPSTT